MSEPIDKAKSKEVADAFWQERVKTDEIIERKDQLLRECQSWFLHFRHYKNMKNNQVFHNFVARIEEELQNVS